MNRHNVIQINKGTSVKSLAAFDTLTGLSWFGVPVSLLPNGFVVNKKIPEAKLLALV